MGGGGTRVARYGFRNLSHHEQTTLFMRVNGSKDVQRPPPWYHVMTDYPPATVLARPLAVQLQDRSRRLKKYKKPSKMFIPQQISHPEDKLRKEFFSDHPWELARPRILLENDGKDAERWDWSKAYEEGRPMDGERYVVVPVTALSCMRHLANYSQRDQTPTISHEPPPAQPTESIGTTRTSLPLCGIRPGAQRVIRA